MYKNLLCLLVSLYSVHAEDLTLTIVQNTNEVALTWNSIPGATYTIEENTLLSTSVWKSAASVLGTGEAMTNTFGVKKTKTFYRINERVNPLFAKKFFIDPNSHARRQADEYSTNDAYNAALLEKIASQPQATWFNGKESDVKSSVQTIALFAAVSNSAPIFVAYNIPKRDCSSFSGGGAVSADAYTLWCHNFAKGIGSHVAVVILEPDALSLMDCLTVEEQQERCALIGQAVHIFKTESAALVYIDGGHSNWLNASEIAERLLKAGIDEADGFSLNVSNFYYDSDLIRYGTSVSKLVHYKHFVIDTSRNGAGPVTDPSFENPWCNPPNRALGRQVTSVTDVPLLDAYLWIKKPGESDGNCREGEPSAGVWMLDYALGLAERAAY